MNGVLRMTSMHAIAGQRTAGTSASFASASAMPRGSPTSNAPIVIMMVTRNP